VTGTALWRSWLYVPGDRIDVIDKALVSEADCVIIDLEDSVHANNKEIALSHACTVIARNPDAPIVVRINAVGTPWHDKEVVELSRAQVQHVRVPKCESAVEVRKVSESLGENCRLHLLIESAKGLQASDDLAAASETVGSLGLGEADLRADLGITEDTYLSYAGGRVVASSRAAGLGAPPQSVFVDLKDDTGLRQSTEHARAAGFFGRSVIHPCQIQIVNEIFTPHSSDVARAREITESFHESASKSSSVLVLEDGRFIDPAIVKSAQRVMDLAAIYGVTEPTTSTKEDHHD
jgi:citrate lyase subunit beta / citryl-CoA lyase